VKAFASLSERAASPLANTGVPIAIKQHSVIGALAMEASLAFYQGQFDYVKLAF
jgi:hypothetical protein